MTYRRIDISHKTIRSWYYKFRKKFENIVKKKRDNFQKAKFSYSKSMRVVNAN